MVYWAMTLSLLFMMHLGVVAAAESRACVGVVTAGGGSDYWRLVREGAKQAARENDLVLMSRGASDENNIAGQALVLENFVKKRCIGLVVAPNSAARGGFSAQLLANEGIPTVFIDRDVGGGRVSVIKTNNYQAGYQVATLVADSLKDECRRVAVFQPSDKVVATRERVQGFMDALAKEPNIAVDVFDVGTTVGEARSRSKQVLKQLKGVAALFTPNQSTTLALLIARESEGMEEILHFGFDPNRNILNAFKAGSIHGVVEQDPFFIGYLGVTTVFKAAQGEVVESRIDVPFNILKHN